MRSMMGELKSVDVREVYSQKVCRVTIDIPFQDVDNNEVGGMDTLAFLNHRVGKKAGIQFRTLDEEQQRLGLEEMDVHEGEEAE